MISLFTPLTRRLRELFTAAEVEFRLSHYRVTHDPLHSAEEWADAWFCFELSRHNLQQARMEYLDAATESMPPLWESAWQLEQRKR